jgi:hypothetical protein
MNAMVDNFLKELHVAIEQILRRGATALSISRLDFEKDLCGEDLTTGSSDVTMAPPAVASLPKENEEENEDRERKKC